jgi:hypothetical protein
MTFEQLMALASTALTCIWMVIAYLLFALQAKTFQVQADVFKEQQKITEMSTIKFLYDIRPNFTTSKNSDIVQPLEGQKLHGKYAVILSYNLAKNLSVINNHQFAIGFVNRDLIAVVAFDRDIEIIEGVFVKGDFQFEVNISLLFEDEVGTSYEQKIHGKLDDLQLDPPIIIKTARLQS